MSISLKNRLRKMQIQLEYKDNDTLRYEYIAYQIDREDGIIYHRITWNLTLNGFLFAALGFFGKGNDIYPHISSFFQIVSPSLGVFSNIAALIGIYAARRQLKYLMDEYEELSQKNNFQRYRWPRPFGVKEREKGEDYDQGQLTSYSGPVLLILAWGVYFVMYIYFKMSHYFPGLLLDLKIFLECI